jgi:Flp pilus assembly protein TadG
MHPETSSSRSRPDRGSVVVETAMVIPVLLAVTVLFVWVASLGATYVRVLDVAQTAARQAARGSEPLPAPDGVTVVVRERDGLIRAEATEEATPPLAAFAGWSVTVRAEAYAAPEWSLDVTGPVDEGLP